MNGVLAETKYTIKNILHNHWADFGSPFYNSVLNVIKENVEVLSKRA